MLAETGGERQLACKWISEFIMPIPLLDLVVIGLAGVAVWRLGSAWRSTAASV
jgi:hypothetical protein